jgi:tyrosine-protein kinase Etk/Wzc
VNAQDPKRPAVSIAGSFDYVAIRSGIIAAKWKIAAITGVSLLLATFYLLSTPPAFRSDALLHIQDPGGMSLPGMAKIPEYPDHHTGTAETESQIIRSRSVLGKAVSSLNLTTDAEPNYFPAIGYPIARFRSEPKEIGRKAVDEDAGNWITNYLWAPGEVRVDRFVVPEHLFGEEFTLRALSVEKYVLIGPDGEKLFSGEVGVGGSGKTGSGEKVEAFVTKISNSAFPSDYTVTSGHWLEAVTDLQSQISVTELGRDSRIVKISYEGENPKKVADIVNKIAETYLRQNVESQSEQAGRRLEILERQIPEIKDALTAAELRMNRYREENLALDLGVEARALLEQVVEIERQMSEFRLKSAELRQTYTSEHPLLKAIDDQMHSLALAKRRLETEIEQLPEAQQEMLELTRDVGVNNALYMEFLNNAQELRLMESGAVGNIRIIDRAVVPIEPSSPQPAFVLVAALIFGLMLGIGYALAKTFLGSEAIESA